MRHAATVNHGAVIQPHAKAIAGREAGIAHHRAVVEAVVATTGAAGVVNVVAEAQAAAITVAEVVVRAAVEAMVAAADADTQKAKIKSAAPRN